MGAPPGPPSFGTGRPLPVQWAGRGNFTSLGRFMPSRGREKGTAFVSLGPTTCTVTGCETFARSFNIFSVALRSLLFPSRTR